MKEIFLRVFTLLVFATSACNGPNVGGVGWDEKRDINEAKSYPAIASDRIVIRTEEVPFGTFKQEFDTVFRDFPYSGMPVSSTSSNISKTQISGTPYSISYESYVLKIFRDDVMIVERKLPQVFYMHPLSSGVILGKSRNEDVILCRTISRATTGLHYILITDGNGEIQFEKVMGARDDWDILLNENKDIVIGGANTKTTITWPG